MPGKQKHRGDEGITGLGGGRRVPKHDPTLRVLGALDEASAAIGLARSMSKNDNHHAILLETQRHLYLIMADIAHPMEADTRNRNLASKHLDWINSVTGELEGQIKLPNQFILPGDSVESAALSLARTIVRRAERELAEYIQIINVFSELHVPWLNRLSHLLFLLEVSPATNSAGKPTLVK